MNHSEQEKNELQREMVAEVAGVPTPLEVQLDSQKAIARISAIANVLEGCAKVSIQRTNPKDWVRMKHQGKESFYLQATGAQKIRPIWGIYYRDRSVTKETNPDGSYSYIVTGKVGSKVLDQLYGEVEVEVDGGRSSSDAFFTGKDSTRTPDPMDVRKASLANWEARAVTALLGLKNLSAEDLTRNGINVKNVAGFEFQDKAEGGGRTECISQAQAKRLYAICASKQIPNDVVKLFLKSHYKLDSSAKILRKDYEDICAWAESGGDEPTSGDCREPGEGE